MPCRPFTEMDPTDRLASSLRPQLVRPVILSPKWTLLTVLRPRSPLSVYVLSSFHRNASADPPATSFRPQNVHPLVPSLKSTLLIILCPCLSGRTCPVLPVKLLIPMSLRLSVLPPSIFYVPTIYFPHLLRLDCKLFVPQHASNFIILTFALART